LTAVGVTWLYGFDFEIKVIAKLPWLAPQQRDNFRHQRICANLDQREVTGRLNRRGAARLVQAALPPFDQRFVRMPGDHQLHALIQVRRHIGQVVHQQHLPALHLEPVHVRQTLGPGQRQVVVATHHPQRCQRCKRLKHLWLADVAGVHDQRAALERRQRFGRSKPWVSEITPTFIARPSLPAFDQDGHIRLFQ
jgi:hypothetical protein